MAVERYPNLCSAAFVLECSKGCGQIVGSFLERMDEANAYRGELLGLMAIHLILLSVNKNQLHAEGEGGDCLGLPGGDEKSLVSTHVQNPFAMLTLQYPQEHPHALQGPQLCHVLHAH